MSISKESSEISAGPAAPASEPACPGPVNPAALTVEQLARMLALPEEKVRDHVAAGAPVAADGTINLIHYAAWLNKQLRSAEGETRRGEELDGD